jgi:uncharacterized protein YegJ (DUF2314 family)
LKIVQKPLLRKVMGLSFSVGGFFALFLFVQTAFSASTSVNVGLRVIPPITPDPPVYIVTVVDQYKAYFEGTADANEEVHIRIVGENGYSSEVVVQVDAFGDWSYQTGILSGGNYSTIAWTVLTEWDIKGTDSADHPFTIDLLSPTFTTTVNEDEYTITLAGSNGFPGGVAHIDIDGPDGDSYSDEVYIDLDGNWSYESDVLNGGDHDITVYSLDGYNNPGPSSTDSVSIDLQETNFDIEVNGSNEATISGTGAIPDGIVRLEIEGNNGYTLEEDVEADGDGDWDYATNVLGSGTYTVTAYVVDGNDEEGPETDESFTIAMIAPTFTVTLIGQNRKLEYVGVDGFPNGMVHIVLTGPDGYLLNEEVSVDAFGNWYYLTQPLTKEGNYETWAYSLDTNGQSGPVSATQQIYIPPANEVDDGGVIGPIDPTVTDPTTSTEPEDELTPMDETESNKDEKLVNEKSAPSTGEKIKVSVPSLLPKLPGPLEDWRKNIAFSMEGNPIGFFFLGVIFAGIASVPVFFKLGSVGQLLTAVQGMLQNSYLLPFIFGRSKRKTGLVYNSQTGEPIPLAKVRLFNENGQEMGTFITDTTGTYNFNVPEGKYVLDVEKKGYAFYGNNNASAVYYANSYSGDQLTCTESKNIISKDIALSPVYYEKQEEVKHNKSEIIFDILFVAGFFISVLFFIIHTTTWYFIPPLIFIASGFLQRIYARKLTYGIVIREKDMREPNAIIEVYDKITGAFVARTTTDSEGKYYLMLDPGIFSLTVSRKGSDAWTKGEIVTSEEKLIKKKIHLTA